MGQQAGPTIGVPTGANGAGEPPIVTAM